MTAEAVVSSTLQLLGTLLIQKVTYLKGVEEKVELLKDELKRMLCFLKDANKKQGEDERVRIWISDIRDIAHDAKDAIEMFVLKIERKGMLGRISSYTKHAHYVNKVGKEIDCIQNRLNDINRSRQLYDIRDLGDASESQELRRRPPPWQNDEHLVGMKDEVKKLREEWITNEEKGLSIAVVEGMGGIGKSTLARKLYSHDDVVFGGLFECCGWVVVSSEFTPKETIKQLIFQLSRSEEEKQKLLERLKNLGESMKDKVYLRQELEEMLHKLLEGKSYFIVLDDVWEMEHLEALISAFPNQQDKTSRLLITTRNKVIAKYGHYALEMEVLDPDKSWNCS